MQPQMNEKNYMTGRYWRDGKAAIRFRKAAERRDSRELGKAAPMAAFAR